MGKNDPTGKAHATVTKTSSQPSSKSTLKHEMSEAMPSGNVELKTPSGFLSGLSGINQPSNKSDSRSVGAGSGAKNQSSLKGLGGDNLYIYPTGPDTTVSSDSDNENFGSASANNIKKHKRE